MRALLGGDRAAAFAAGLAPALGRAIDRRVAGVLTADRFAHYINVLYGLALLRRGHELEPLHEELFRQVAPAQAALGPYGLAEFAADLEQLVGWGAIERTTEALKLRTYKDNRRVRFRYRLGDDAASLLEWLEARASARAHGRVRDGRDLLADVLGFLKEARALCDRWRTGEGGADDARRAVALLEAVGDAIDAIAVELVGFRAEMTAFAGRPYDLATLRQILGWLERYVAHYVERLESLRGELEGRLVALAAPRYRAALAGCRAALVAERAAAPALARGAGPLPATDAMVDDAVRFFGAGGQLAELGRHIAASGRAVLLKMHRHLVELERRSARRADLRAAIRGLCGADDDVVGAEALAELAGGLIAAAHLRTAPERTSASDRTAPPVPRRHQGDAARRAPAQPLRRKPGGVEEARALRARRLAELGEWVTGEVLAGADEVVLSMRGLPAAAVRRWMDVARARHLGGGREARAMPAQFEARAGDAVVGDEREGLRAPDCAIRRR